MPWFNDTRFQRSLSGAIDVLQKQEYVFRNPKPVVFLCGGFESERREQVKSYLIANHDYLVFYADDVWEELSLGSTNALEMEEALAELSDIVIIIVESPGTFAELGAFALSEKLRHKLLPIRDSKTVEHESFINTGPIRWIDKDSRFKPSVVADFDNIIDSIGIVVEKIDSIERKDRRITNLLGNSKGMLLFICDICSIFGPVSIENINYLINRILLDELPNHKTNYFVSLAVALNLVTSFEYNGANRFMRKMKKGEVSFHSAPPYSLATLRLEVLNAMQKNSEARAALKALDDQNEPA